MRLCTFLSRLHTGIKVWIHMNWQDALTRESLQMKAHSSLDPRRKVAELSHLALINCVFVAPPENVSTILHLQQSHNPKLTVCAYCSCHYYCNLVLGWLNKGTRLRKTGRFYLKVVLLGSSEQQHTLYTGEDIFNCFLIYHLPSLLSIPDLK